MKSLASDKSYDIYDFWQRTRGRPKKKRRKASKSDVLPSDKDQAKILKTMYKGDEARVEKLETIVDKVKKTIKEDRENL